MDPKTTEMVPRTVFGLLKGGRIAGVVERREQPKPPTEQLSTVASGD
jgi:hypothetical protein